MAGKIKSDIIQGESSLKLNVGETTIITVDAANYNIAQPLNVQSTMTVIGSADFVSAPTFSAGLGDVSIGNATITGNLTVSGTEVIIDTETLNVEDKNITIANVASPSDSLADGAGLTIKGTTDKTLTWSNTTKAFTFDHGIDIQQVIETANVDSTALNANTNFDVLEGAVKYYSANNAANWTLNVRGDSSTTLNSVMNTGDSLTIAYLASQLSANTFYQSEMQVDGNSVTPKWQGGSAPSAGNATSIDVYSFTILKTAENTYTVLGSQTQYA